MITVYLLPPLVAFCLVAYLAFRLELRKLRWNTRRVLLLTDRQERQPEDECWKNVLALSRLWEDIECSR